MSGKYNYLALVGGVPCFVRLAPSPNNTEEESYEKVCVTLQYNREWESESNKFSGWSFVAFEEAFTGEKVVDGPPIFSLFELETTGNFEQRFDLDYLETLCFRD